MIESISKEFINFIKSSDFYNKIQVVVENDGEQTETFYFYDGVIGHAILLTKTDGSVEIIQDTEEISLNEAIEKLKIVDPESKVIIAGNSSENILTLKM